MSLLSELNIKEQSMSYFTKDGIQVNRTLKTINEKEAVESILHRIDECKGVLFSSSYEFPGRYSRWDIGFVNPPIEFRAYQNRYTISSLNDRGKVLLDAIEKKLISKQKITKLYRISSTEICGEIISVSGTFYEEERSQQPSIFSIIRELKDMFFSIEDTFLGLYGAFGYDLVFEFEPMELKNKRMDNQEILVLYIPDQINVVDHKLSLAYQLSYEFEYMDQATQGLSRESEKKSVKQHVSPEPPNSYVPGYYAGMVRKAIESFKSGDLFEVVPCQTWVEQCPDAPSIVFQRLKTLNPSPYGFIINLGEEHLVGSSPEMYVRVKDRRVETCPISGTIKRGNNAIEDAEQIRTLLNSLKDESELTMCTDVDRNDKSRICEPGSVKVIGRRQPEMYSHLIHTVDHVEGQLRGDFDSVDAFISHMWAVTITGAPKRAAIRWIEDNEKTSRSWYGGSVGYMAFCGDINTGLTLRTIKISQGIAEIKVGATLLHDSIPDAEEEETLLKAAALVKSLNANDDVSLSVNQFNQKIGYGLKILFIDHEDSFVHTLASYFRQTGAETVTLRSNAARTYLADNPNLDLVVLSPGPGRPSDFQLNQTLKLCINKKIPVFGVCLGFQGMIEYFNGTLGLLDTPRHGKSMKVKTSSDTGIWDNMPNEFKVGLYHSIYATHVSDDFTIIATSEEGVVMGIEHKELPIIGIQFHPESIYTAVNDNGLRIVENVIKTFCRPKD